MSGTIALSALILTCCLTPARQAGAQAVPVYALAKAAAVDGDAADWSSIPFTRIGLRKTRPDGNRGLRGRDQGRYPRRPGLFPRRMAGRHARHPAQPWAWDSVANKSVTGPQREDRLALQFAIDGDYTTGWLSGRALGADSWHCKTSRSNPLGLAHDKSLVISREKLLRAQRVGRGRTGQGNLAGRPSVPRVEQETRDRPRRRRLLPATAARILGGIAVFQQSENDDHAISDTLTFDFLHRPGPAR